MAEIYVLAEIRTKTRGCTVTESRSLPMSSTCWRSQVLLQRALSLRESENVVGYGYAVGRVCAVRDGCTRDDEYKDECSWAVDQAPQSNMRQRLKCHVN